MLEIGPQLPCRCPDLDGEYFEHRLSLCPAFRIIDHPLEAEKGTWENKRKENLFVNRKVSVLGGMVHWANLRQISR